jgi:hypothetical protein
MNIDIRIAVSFRDHRKRRELRRLLGPAGEIALVDLWLFAAESRPDGNLTGLSVEDIAKEARWEGDPKAFVDGLIRAKFIEKRRRNLQIHDWNDHNFYAANIENRRRAAQKANHVRWLNKRGIECSDKRCPFCDRTPVRTPVSRKADSDSDSDRNPPPPIHTVPIHTRTTRAREAADAWNRRAAEFGKPAVDDAEVEVVTPFIDVLTDRIRTIRPDFTWTAAVNAIEPKSWIVQRSAHFSFSWLTKDGRATADLNAIKAFDGKYSSPDDGQRQFDREGDDPVFDAKGRARRVVE